MQNEAEDAGGLACHHTVKPAERRSSGARLAPVKDDNEVMRKSSQKATAIFWLGGVLV